VRIAVTCSVENRTLDVGNGRGRRKLRNEEFDDLCVGKDDDVRCNGR
jgi:hypothetical protein